MNEADTCRKLIRPKLEAVGWDAAPHLYNEQVSFTDGRIVVAGAHRHLTSITVLAVQTGFIPVT
jgi:type I site-specific restriction endonuclease